MKKLLLILSLSCATYLLTAQQNVGIGTTTPNSNAQLDVVANDKGVLFPRLSTTQRNTLGGSIGNAEEGMLVFDSSIEAFFYWDGSAWNEMGGGSGLWTDQLPTGIYHSTGNVAIGGSPVGSMKLRTISLGETTTSTRYAGYFYNGNTVNSSGIKYGLYSEATSNGTGEKRGVYGYAVQNGSSAGPVYGVYGQTSSAGGGNQDNFGVYGGAYNSGNARQFGVYGTTSSAGNGTRYGVYGVGLGATSATTYGAYFESRGGVNGAKYGSYSKVEGGTAQTSSTYAAYNFNVPTSSSTNTSYGTYSRVSNNGNGTKYAAYNYVVGSTTQTGAVYGTRSYASSNGTAANAYGIYANVSSSGSGTHYGIYTSASTAPNNWASYNVGNSYFSSDVRLGHTGDVPGYKLSVNGKVICEELRIELDADWPDYVFASDYDLPTIKEVKAHINEKKHLPGIPSAAEIEKQGGLDVGDMNKRLLEKVEELTLYIIELNDKVENQHKEIQKLKDSK